MPDGRLPFEPEGVRGDREEELAGRKVRRRGGLDGIGMSAGREGAPVAGGERFHFAVDDLHGDRALIVTAGGALFRRDREGGRQQHGHEQQDGDEEFDEDAAVSGFLIFDF